MATYTVSKGVVSNGVYLSAGDVMNILAGGKATLTSAWGGIENITKGGIAESSYIASSGIQNVNGGSAINTTVYGGSQIVNANGSALNTSVGYEGFFSIDKGGYASNLTISSGGRAHFNAGATISKGVNLNNTSGNNTFTISKNVASNLYIESDYFDIGNKQKSIKTTLAYAGVENVSKGGVASRTEINSGGQQCIFASGTASSAKLNSYGAEQIIFTKGKAIGTQVHGGHQQVSGGLANNTIISGEYWDTLQTIYKNGTASITTVTSGIQNVSGGKAVTTVLNEYGTQNVYSGSASDTTINEKGVQNVYQGGSALQTKVLYGGSLFLDTGAYVKDLAISAGGIYTLDAGATVLAASNTAVNSSFTIKNKVATSVYLANGTLNVSDATSSVKTEIDSLGTENVYSGGLSISATINESGYQNVENGGTAQKTIISGGSQHLNGGKSVSVTLLYGYQTISSGGIANTTVVSKGLQSVFYKGSSLQTTVKSGASIYIDNGAYVSGLTLSAGAGATFYAGATVTKATNKNKEKNNSFSIQKNIASNVYVFKGNLFVNEGQKSSKTQIATAGYEHIYGGSSVSATVLYGGSQTISGGTAEKTVVQSGGTQTVYSGSAASAIINEGGDQNVIDNGYATLTTINAGGFQHIGSGGSGHKTIIKSGGIFSIQNKGYISGLTISSGGQIRLNAGATVLNAINKNTENSSFTISKNVARNVYLQNGVLDVTEYQSSVKTIVASNGYENISSGGLSLSATITQGGVQQISFDGMVQNAVVSSSGCQQLTWSGKAIGTTLNAGGSQNVYDGGIASKTQVNNKGFMTVFVRGSAYGIAIASGGRALVSDSGYISGVTIAKGGNLSMDTNTTVLGGTNANHTSVLSGVKKSQAKNTAFSVKDNVASNVYILDGTLSVLENGTSLNTILGSNGKENISEGTANGTVIGSNGQQTLNSWKARAHKTTVNSAGNQIVYGGIAYNTTVNAGGQQFVGFKNFSSSMDQEDSFSSSTAQASNTVVRAKGIQEVQRGGSAYITTIASGAHLIAGDGAYLKNVTVVSGGITSFDCGATIISGTNNNRTGSEKKFSIRNGIASNVYVNGKFTIRIKQKSYNSVVAKGGYQIITSGGYAEKVNVKAGGTLSLDGGARISNYTIASGANIIVNSDVAMQSLNAKNANLTIAGCDNNLKALNVTTKTSLTFDLNNVVENNDTMLKADTAAAKAGKFALSVGKAQEIGTYNLASNFTLKTGTVFTITQEGTSLGKAKVNSTALTKNGVTYSVKMSSKQLLLTLTTKAGSMLKGKSTLTGSVNSDIFYGSKENNIIDGKDGRDVAVYDTNAWGQDTIKKTNGTMTLVFNDLTSDDISVSYENNNAIITRNNTNQKITVQGWNDTTHNILFESNLTAFNKWSKATSTAELAKTSSAARNEIWKRASLA